MDAAYHFQPDLLALLIEAIPLVCRSKKDVLQFFRSAGVPEQHTRDMAAALAADRTKLNKYEITRTVLTRINEHGDATLAARREVIRRVVEFDDFSVCWPDDQLKAQGLVSRVRNAVNVKDSFTRMQQEREEERRRHREEVAQAARALQQREAELDQIKDDLFRLFAETNTWRRGKSLEVVLNRLFRAHGVLVRDAFTVTGKEGEGVVEQIDGVVDLQGDIYLVEMKWWEKALGPGELGQHMVRVASRDQARGIFIAASGYTDAALTTCKEALQRGVFILVELQEIVRLLNERGDLKSMLLAKVRAAIIDKQPLFTAW